MIPTITAFEQSPDRGEAQPAFKRAFDAQLAVFTGKALGPQKETI